MKTRICNIGTRILIRSGQCLIELLLRNIKDVREIQFEVEGLQDNGFQLIWNSERREGLFRE